MIDRICVLDNYTLSQPKQHFQQKLLQAFERREIETKIFTPDQIAEIQAFDPQLSLSFNPFLPAQDNLYLWDILEIPHLYIHLEPALYASHLTKSPYIIISCADRKDSLALRSDLFPRAFFLPRAIEREITYKENDPRPYEIVFLGSCYDYETLDKIWQGDLSPTVIQFLNDAVSLVLADHSTSLAEAVVQAWTKTRLDYQKSDLITLYKYIDYFSRGKDRVDLIQSIKQTKVHVFGDIAPDIPSCTKSWNHYLKNQPNVVLHPAVSFEESLVIMKQSKVILNSSPFFKDGAHERILYAYACGALSCTNDNLWVRQQFVDGQDIVLYQNHQLEHLEEKLKPFLLDETLRREAVNQGRQKVLKKHTWDNRVEEILGSLKDVTEG